MGLNINELQELAKATAACVKDATRPLLDRIAELELRVAVLAAASSVEELRALLQADLEQVPAKDTIAPEELKVLVDSIFARHRPRIVQRVIERYRDGNAEHAQ